MLGNIVRKIREECFSIFLWIVWAIAYFFMGVVDFLAKTKCVAKSWRRARAD